MQYPDGFIGWVDLTTGDVPAAKEFYSRLFGWQLRDVPTPVGVDYTMLLLDGRLVAGMGPQPPDPAASGAPSAWTTYVLVDDADATAHRALEAGGSVLMTPADVMDQGRLALIADPTGAVIGLWQPREHQGAEVFNVPGALTWNELQTRDLGAAQAFYAMVFGWRWETDASGYSLAMLDSKAGADKSVAGAMTMPPAVPAEAPAHWLVYFAVADCDEAVDRAVALGATVFLPAMAMGPGRFAGITDPTGAMFMLGSWPMT